MMKEFTQGKGVFHLGTSSEQWRTCSVNNQSGQEESGVGRVRY